MQIEIEVVDYESEPWFQFEGLKFDTLDAFWELDCKKFQVMRNGEVIATGRVFEARGEPVFNDYGSGKGIRLYGSALRAEDFLLSDHLMLDVPDEFNLVNKLTESCRFLGAVITSMSVGQKMTMNEARERITTELESAAPSETPAQVLRFRRCR